ncbi:Vesicle-associated protein 2-2 [Linum perenne]
MVDFHPWTCFFVFADKVCCCMLRELQKGSIMAMHLVEIQPKELKFTFELKKQSSCAVRLLNNSYHTVAFKVKTTSPKKYCVRPNVGVMLPKSICEFTVTMQAQKVAPPDMICKDKFLIQTTVVPIGTSDEDITPLMFSKEKGGHIEETKLRVVLVSQLGPPESPLSSPDIGSLKQINQIHLDAPVLTSIDNVTQVHPCIEDEEFNHGFDDAGKNTSSKPKKVVVEDEEEVKPINVNDLVPDEDEVDEEESTKPKVEEVRRENNATTVSEFTSLKAEVNSNELKPAKIEEQDNYVTEGLKEKDADDIKFITVKKAVEEPQLVNHSNEPKLVSEIEAMKTKLDALEVKFNEAQSIISKLMEEKKSTNRERKTLKEEVAQLKSVKMGMAGEVEAGIPILQVVIVALISILLGYLLHG